MRFSGLMLMVVSCAELSSACAVFEPAPEEKPECSEDALAALVFDCRAKRKDECKGVPYESCKFVKECDKKIDDWEKCQ